MRSFALAVLVTACGPEAPSGESSSGGQDGGADNGPGCAEACAVILDCDTIYDTEAECMSDCRDAQDAASSLGAACAAAEAAVNRCIAGLSCAEFEAFVDQSPPGSFPCKAEWDRLFADCDF